MTSRPGDRLTSRRWGVQVTLCCLFFVVQPAAAARPPRPEVDPNHVAIICRNILQLDCDVFHTDVNCGTDGVTYNNSCQFAKSHCLSPDIHVLHAGRCRLRPATPTTGVMQEGLAVVLALVCGDVVHVDCTQQPANELCASDGLTYSNNCFFEHARCDRYDLHVIHAGAC